MYSPTIFAGLQRYVLVEVGASRYDPLIKVVDTPHFHDTLRRKGYNSLLIQLSSDSMVPLNSTMIIGQEVSKKDDFQSCHYIGNPSIDYIKGASFIISHPGNSSLGELMRADKPLVLVTDEQFSSTFAPAITSRASQKVLATTCQGLENAIDSQLELFLKSHINFDFHEIDDLSKFITQNFAPVIDDEEIDTSASFGSTLLSSPSSTQDVGFGFGGGIFGDQPLTPLRVDSPKTSSPSVLRYRDEPQVQDLADITAKTMQEIHFSAPPPVETPAPVTPPVVEVPAKEENLHFAATTVETVKQEENVKFSPPVNIVDEEEDPAAKKERLRLSGNTSFQGHRYEEAVKFYSEALELAPSENDHILHSNRSASYQNLNELDKAYDDAVKTVELNPKWAKGYLRLGRALAGLQKYTEAIERLNYGISISNDETITKQFRVEKVGIEEELKRVAAFSDEPKVEVPAPAETTNNAAVPTKEPAQASPAKQSVQEAEVRKRKKVVKKTATGGSTKTSVKPTKTTQSSGSVPTTSNEQAVVQAGPNYTRWFTAILAATLAAGLIFLPRFLRK